MGRDSQKKVKVGGVFSGAKTKNMIKEKRGVVDSCPFLMDT